MKRLTPLICAAVLLNGCASSYWSEPLPERLSENIYLTSSNAGSGLIGFLLRNDGKRVEVDTYLDASMARSENQTVQEQCAVDIDALIDGSAVGKPLALPTYESLARLDCDQYRLVLETGPDTLYQYSSGGTGIVVVHLRGSFTVVRKKTEHGIDFYLHAEH
ncbi:hypothetical protein [Halopseudomonas sp.]|uniref:hypothetical protein n=1 Tax=Halopseudomonas sp. TaxID=2901191 RepID=UPI00311ED91C